MKWFRRRNLNNQQISNIVGPPLHPNAHIDYTFGQVSLDRQVVDYNVTCGNFVTAVGLYAAEEGYVPLTEPVTSVHIYNTNTNGIIVADIPVKDGQIQYDDDFSIAGVPGTASRILLNFLNAGGTFTGRHSLQITQQISFCLRMGRSMK